MEELSPEVSRVNLPTVFSANSLTQDAALRDEGSIQLPYSVNSLKPGTAEIHVDPALGLPDQFPHRPRAEERAGHQQQRGPSPAGELRHSRQHSIVTIVSRNPRHVCSVSAVPM